MRSFHQQRRSRFRHSPAQFELPLDYSRSEPGARLHNPSRSRVTFPPALQDRLASNSATLWQPGIALVSSKLDNIDKFICKGHPFWLTSSISAIIDKVIQKGRPANGATLPPLNRSPDVKSGQGCSHERGRGPRRLQTNPLGFYRRRAGLPALRLLRLLRLQDPRAFQVPRLRPSIQRDQRDDLRRAVSSPCATISWPSRSSSIP